MSPGFLPTPKKEETTDSPHPWEQLHKLVLSHTPGCANRMAIRGGYRPMIDASKGLWWKQHEVG